MNRTALYKALRRSGSGVFGTSLSQGQVEGIEGLLNAFGDVGDGKDDTLAYALATTYHETGRKMLPVREGFRTTDQAARAYVQRNYGHKGRSWYCWPAGPYGHVYYGRGHPQLTWHDNYVRSSKDAGTDLEKHPDAMLDPYISSRILFLGLLDGRWNKKKKGLRYYLDRNDLKNARRTVNILDKWKTIASYHRSFLTAIQAAGGAQDVIRTPEAISPQRQPRPRSRPSGMWGRFKKLLSAPKRRKS